VAFKSEGVFKISYIDSHQWDGKLEDFYILKKEFSTFNTKTFVPIHGGTKNGLRNTASKNKLTSVVKNSINLGDLSPELNLTPRDLIVFLKDLITKRGFEGLVRAFRTIHIISECNKISDEKLKYFYEKIKNSIIEEIAIVKKIDLQSAELIALSMLQKT